MSVGDPATLAAVLFDMDGLLIDSEGTWLDVEYDVVHRLGGEWSAKHQEHLVGGSVPRTTAYMLELTGAEVSPDEVAQLLVEGMTERLLAGVKLMPGAEELLDDLAGSGVPCVLVSSSYRTLMDAALTSIGPERFALTVAGDEVGRMKPAPDPYLTAAGGLGASPQRCVALEDSPNGLASAEAADCVTVAVPSVTPIEPTPTRTVVASLHELDAWRLDELVRVRLAGRKARDPGRT